MSRPNKSDVAFWAGVTICALALCCYAMFGCAKAAQSAQSLAAAAPLVDDSAEMQADEQAARADEKAHQLVLDRVRAAVLVKVDEAAANAAESAPEAEQDPVYYETEYVDESAYIAPYTPSQADNGDGFVSQGVRDYDGTKETWYSSNILYHYRTPEWTPDDEGYYRDADGYYVVASTDHGQGEVIDTSKGEAKVYDTGCASGVTDFYTNF